MVLANLNRNSEMAKAIVTRAIPLIPAQPNWPCHDSLRNAIMTDRKHWPAETRRELQPILKKYL
jgi:5'-methylthioadenosine phosphorylase